VPPHAEPRARPAVGLPTPCAAAFVALAVLAVGRLLVPAGTVAEVSYLVVVLGAAVLAWCAVARGWRAGTWTAAGVTLSAVGDLVWQLRAWSGAPEADVSVADVAYLASYLAVGLGLRRVVGRVAEGSRFDRFVDTAAVFVVVVYLEWVLALEATVSDDALSPLVRTVWAAYPVLDAWLLALVVRLWFARAGLRAEAAWIAVGAATWFAADLGYLVAASSSAVFDTGWTIGSLALAASSWAALAGRSTAAAPPAVRELPVSGAQIGLTLFPLVLPGAVEVWAFARGTDIDPAAGVLVTAVVVGLAFGRATRLARQQAQLRRVLELRARRAAALAADSADALVVVDAVGRPLPGEHPRSAVWDAVGEADPAGRQDLLDRAAAQPGRVCVAELPSSTGGGWVEVRAVDRTAHPDVQGLVVTMQDVSERHRVQDELAHQAFHDGLTGLANRSLFDDRVAHALTRTGRTGLDPAVLSLDLDGFKTVNDTLGHPAGDELLRQVAGRLRDGVRPADTVARLGGDEFAVLLEPGPGDHVEDHLAVAERLRALLCAPYEVAGRVVRVGVSIGLVCADLDGDGTAASLLRDADTALYRAKAGGKGRVVSFEADMRAELLLRTRLAADLPEALAAGQLRLVYQPVVHLGSGAVEGFEALLRWQHPLLGEVSPAVFVPIAEEDGSIESIGRWALREACGAAASWRDDGADPAPGVAVNVSVRQLRSPHLVDDVAAALTDSGLDPAALCLELTETALVHDTEQAARALHRLRGLGVRLAVDDFGTGYSSLTHLRQFPVDVLKVDRSFVATIGRDGAQPRIVEGLLELARVMGLSVVAEGVETTEQRDLLRDEGCQSAQGWLFARALERAAADELAIAGGVLGPVAVPS
ncbi:GGDEF-domain containing protein, partial [Klenkia terrae]